MNVGETGMVTGWLIPEAEQHIAAITAVKWHVILVKTKSSKARSCKLGVLLYPEHAHQPTHGRGHCGVSWGMTQAQLRQQPGPKQWNSLMFQQGLVMLTG